MSVARRLGLGAAFLTASVFIACGSSDLGLGVPPIGGNSAEPLAEGDLSVRRMVRRAAGELDAGRPDAAELWVRRALVTLPEDTGGLAVLARVYAARGDLAGAREIYRIAAAGGPERAEAVRRERAALLLKLAKAELGAGRVFLAAVVLRELDAAAPSELGHERGELHRALAETWISRGLAPEAAEEARLAEPHGVDLRPIEVRLGHLAAPTPATLAKVGQTLGWRKAAEWLYGLARADEAADAIGRALADDSDDAAAHLDAAFIALAKDGAADAVQQGLGASKAGIAPARLVDLGERLESAGHPAEAGLVYREVLRRDPGQVDAALAAASIALAAGDAAGARTIAGQLGAVRPDAWEQVFRRWMSQRELLVACLGAALATGHVTHAHDARLALAWNLALSGHGVDALPVLDSEAESAGEDVGLVSALAQVTSAMATDAREWLGRYASQHAGTWREAVARAWLAPENDERMGLAPLAAFLASHPDEAPRMALARAALQIARRHYADARTTLEQVLAGHSNAARGSSGADIYRALAEIALRLGAVEAGADERAAVLITTWLAELHALAPAGPATPVLPELEDLVRLADPTRFPASAVVLLGAQRTLAPERKGLMSELGAALLAVHRWDEARAAFEAAVAAVENDPVAAAGGSARALVAVLAERMRGAERPNDALALLERLHPSELERLDALPDLAARFEAGGEPVAADLIFLRLLDAADAGAFPSAKVLALGDQLLELRRPELARRAFARAVEGGDRTSRAFLGWMRAILRASQARQGGDDPRPGTNPDAAGEPDLDEVINRWFESRPKRDDRAREDAANTLRDEGALGRARQIYLDLAAASVPDIGRWSTICDLFRRLGDGKSLPATLEAAATKQRWAAQGTAQLAEKLAAAGEQDAADSFLGARLATQHDPALVSSALQIAMLRGDRARAQELANGLFQQTGASADVWERVLRDLASAGFADIAMGLADQAIERNPRAVKLLILRARWLVGDGRFAQALGDLAEALGRAPAGEDLSQVVAEPLKDALQTERLVNLLARGIANQGSPRSEPILAYARALVDAGRVTDAEQELVKALGDSDRGQAAIASLWFDVREPARGLVHAERGLAELPTDETFGPLGAVSLALAEVGAPAGRVDVFVRLGVQAGADAGAVAQTLLRTGRATEALGWLERALAAAPKPETATLLARARLAAGDVDGAIAAYERVVAARVSEPLPSGRAPQLAGLALATIVPELVQAGEARRAAALVRRMQARYGEGTWLRLLGAYASVEAGDWSDVLARLTAPFEPFRGQREVFPTLQLLVQAMCNHGHAGAAADLLEAALESGPPERDLLAATIRVGARAGRPELAWRAATRLRATLPGMNSWLAGEALAAARMPRSAREILEAGFASAPLGTSLGRAAVALTLSGGVTAAELRTRPSRIREDRSETANIAALVAFTTGHWDEAARALVPTLDEASTDPQRAEMAALAASLAGDDALLSAVVEALGRARGDRVGLRAQLATRLAAAGRWQSATQVYAPLADTRRGSGAVALPAIVAALAAGDDASAERWGATLTIASPDGGSSARIAVAPRWATYGRLARAEALLADVRDGADKARVASMIAVAKAHDDAAWAAIGAEPMATNAQRAQRAELILSSPDRGAARAALAVLETGPEVSASQGVLELRAVAAWRLGERERARQELAEVQKRFPGPLKRADRLVAAAVEAGDADGLAALFAMPLAIPVSARAELLASALLELDGAVDPALGPALERWATDGGAGSAEAIALLDAVPAAETLWAEAPWDLDASAYRAWVLARHGQAERAIAIAQEALGRLPEAGLFDLDARPVSAPQTALAARALGQAELAAGHPELALAAFDRSLAARLDGAVVGLRADALARLGQTAEAVAGYRACAAQGTMEAWARRCRVAGH